MLPPTSHTADTLRYLLYDVERAEILCNTTATTMSLEQVQKILRILDEPARQLLPLALSPNVTQEAPNPRKACQQVREALQAAQTTLYEKQPLAYELRLRTAAQQLIPILNQLNRVQTNKSYGYLST